MGINRVLLMIMDGVGIGALPDAAQYGDEGAHSLRHVSEKIGGFKLPNFEKLGLGGISDIPGLRPDGAFVGSYGKLYEVSPGKDTTTGHWEMAGIHLDKPFPIFPNGFPSELIDNFVKETGVKKILGNKPASGTEIIKELGVEHIKTEHPIVYTSGDSVFQIACHEDVYPLEELYNICRVARRLCDPYDIGRVIARPFSGESPETFVRTPYRKDFSYALPEPMLLDFLKDKDIEVIGVGKISDIFNQQGIARSVISKSNASGIQTSIDEIKKLKRGLVFTNLVDFDQQYGHRNDVQGYANALTELDKKLPELMDALGEDGMLILSADHGTDPTHPGTDHTREYVPLLVYGKSLKSKNLGTRETIADIGQTIADVFKISPLKHGKSFLADLI